jgi:hypothetical protein
MWFDPELLLPEIVGRGINPAVCFEILGDCFYAVSNRAMFQEDKIEWNSYGQLSACMSMRRLVML